MNPAELQQMLTEIHEAFPYVKRRLNDSPRVLAEWSAALRPLASYLVSEGVSRWIHHNNTDPTLDQFLSLLDGLAEERRRRSAAPRPESEAVEAAAIIGDVLLHAVHGARDEHDQAWGRLHVDIFMKGLAIETSGNRRTRAGMYRQFAQRHPTLAGVALDAATRCEE